MRTWWNEKMKGLPISRPGLAHGLCTMVSFGPLTVIIVVLTVFDCEVSFRKLVVPIFLAGIFSMFLFDFWKKTDMKTL